MQLKDNNGGSGSMTADLEFLTSGDAIGASLSMGAGVLSLQNNSANGNIILGAGTAGASSILPNTDSVTNIGSSGKKFKDCHISGAYNSNNQAGITFGSLDCQSFHIEIVGGIIVAFTQLTP